MRVSIISAFPEPVEAFLGWGPVGRALRAGSLSVRLLSLRDYAEHPKAIDDYPFGGIPGMLLRPEPLLRALADAGEGLVINLTPQGRLLDQGLVARLAREEHLILLCGRYKGIDARAEARAQLHVSIGDYIISGGELAAMVLLDAVARLLPGALGDVESGETDSLVSGFLEGPLYTRPRDYLGMRVPEVLVSGNHGRISRWRKREALARTLRRRPDLLARDWSLEEAQALLELLEVRNGRSHKED